MIHKINNTMDNRNKNINGPQDKQHNGNRQDKQNKKTSMIHKINNTMTIEIKTSSPQDKQHNGQ